MYRTLNMGIGLVLVVERNSPDRIIHLLAKEKLKAWVIGEVVKGKEGTKIV